MTYYDYLCRLLEPMRIYRTERGTLSGAELYAAGAALDGVDGAMEYAEREGVLQTAEGEGLARREKLFSRCPVNVSTALRREAIAALERINADSFTLDAINSTLQRLRHQSAGGGNGEKGDGQGLVSQHSGRAGGIFAGGEHYS